VPLSLRSKPALTFEIARALADVAEAQIAAQRFAMFVAVVDDAGTPLYVARFNDAQPASYEVALKKAQASVRFRRATKAFEERVIRDGRVNLLSMPGIVAVEGGLPLVVDGAVVGAIGVSGGTGVEDGQVAAAAAESLPGLLGIARNSS
jgi:glc operon protein GlcG